MMGDYHGAPSGESPKRDGTPSRSTENAQLQWVIETLSQLKSSHDTLSTRIEYKLENIESKLDTKHKSFDEKIDSHQTLMCSKIENTELKLHKSISDSRIDGIKWIVGLAVGFPSVVWAVVQIVKTISK